VSKDVKTYPIHKSFEEICNPDRWTTVSSQSILRSASKLVDAVVQGYETTVERAMIHHGHIKEGEKLPESTTDSFLTVLLIGVASYAAADASMRGKQFSATEFANLARKVGGVAEKEQESVEAEVGMS